MSAVFYLEGGQLYNFVVRAKNIDSVESTLATSSRRSNELGKLKKDAILHERNLCFTNMCFDTFAIFKKLF